MGRRGKVKNEKREAMRKRKRMKKGEKEQTFLGFGQGSKRTMERRNLFISPKLNKIWKKKKGGNQFSFLFF